MIMKSGEQWHCTNPWCHCEIVVQTNTQVGGDNPRCACGSVMKKKYVSPHVTYLEFLQIEETVPAAGGSRKG